MARILGYSDRYDKLTDSFPPLPKEVTDTVGDVHHTTIRLNKQNGYYQKGTWQEVFKPRSKDREIIRPVVNVRKPIEIKLHELKRMEQLLYYDTMKNDKGMEYKDFYAFAEKFYLKSGFWYKEETDMLILPIDPIDLPITKQTILMGVEA